MKLYEIPRGSYFRIVSEETSDEDDSKRVPPGAPEVDSDEIYWLGNIDGAYSYCKDSSGQVVHIIAWADVEIVEK